MPKHLQCIYDDIQIKYKEDSRPATIERIRMAIFFRGIKHMSPLYITEKSAVCKKHITRSPLIKQPIKVIAYCSIAIFSIFLNNIHIVANVIYMYVVIL